MTNKIDNSLIYDNIDFNFVINKFDLKFYLVY